MLAFPIIVITNSKVDGVEVGETWQLPPNVAFPYLPLGPAASPLHPHFPYGIAVEPDAPL